MSQAPFGRVLLMRHPETVGNVEHFFSGRRDVGLSDEGERQRDRAVEALVAWAPDRILCSPLSRGRAIAEPAAERLGIEAVADERLIEIEFGEAEGLTVPQVRERGLAFPWPVRDGASCPCEGGESFEHLIARARDLAEELATLGGKTACVTHGGLTRAFLAAVYDTPLERFWQLSIPNVSSQVFLSRGGHLMLSALGLTPEELRARSESGSLAIDNVPMDSGESR